MNRDEYNALSVAIAALEDIADALCKGLADAEENLHDLNERVKKLEDLHRV